MIEIRQKRIKRLKKRNDNVREFRKKNNYICLYANKNKRITQEEIKTIQTDLISSIGLTKGKLTKMYNCKVTIIPNKILTNKGILVRMGKGKGKIKTVVKYLTQGTICIELIPNSINIQEVPLGNEKKILKKFLKKYTYLSYKLLI